jgi:hypothetical protein
LQLFYCRYGFSIRFEQKLNNSVYIERTKDFTSQILCASITIVIIAEILLVRCKIISAINIKKTFEYNLT